MWTSRIISVSNVTRTCPLSLEPVPCHLPCHLAIDDAVMEEVRPSITSGMDEEAWVQLQVEALFSRIAASRRKVSFDDEYMTNLINLSAPAWVGVKDADEWIHDLRGE